MNNQTISLAEVVYVGDAAANGSFQAVIKTLDDKPRTIFYVSPYASNGQGAFVAIPEVGTKILVCSPEKNDAWFYLGATFIPEQAGAIGDAIPQPPPLERVVPNLYRSRGVPMQMALKSPNGAGLLISEEYTPKYINKKTEITSSTNKKISLIDSPAIDSIILDSGNNSKITLSNDPQNFTVPAQAIQVESAGPQKYLNTRSQTDIFVGENGRELQLINQGNGDIWGDFPGFCGNVNIQSDKKDVNIFTKAAEGRIFIECINTSGSNQVIEIQTNGEDGAIRIKTNGKVDISAKNIGINATDSINIKAGGAINIEAGADLSLKSGGTVFADGTPNIRLNEGGSSNADPGIGNTESYYDNSGVTI